MHNSMQKTCENCPFFRKYREIALEKTDSVFDAVSIFQDLIDKCTEKCDENRVKLG